MDDVTTKLLDRIQTELPLAERPYAEHRACDIEGNMFDLSVHGFQRSETLPEREAAKVPAQVKDKALV